MQKDHIQINAPNLTYKRCVRRTKRRFKKNKCIPDFGNDTGYSLAQINVVDFHKNPCDKLLKLKFGKPFYM